MNAVDRWASDLTEGGNRFSGPGATCKEGAHLSTTVYKAYKEWNKKLPRPEKYIDTSQHSEPTHGYER